MDDIRTVPGDDDARRFAYGLLGVTVTVPGEAIRSDGQADVRAVPCASCYARA